MDSINNPVLRLRAQIASLEGILADLRTQLTHAEAYYNQISSAQADSNGDLQNKSNSYPPIQPVGNNQRTFETLVDQLDLPQECKWGRSWELTSEEHKRYGRQLIMTEIGLRGRPSSPKVDVRLSLTRNENRAATT